VSTDYAILRHFMQNQTALPYVEVEVMASSGENPSVEMMRFEQGP
jgi:hypothetical protein